MRRAGILLPIYSLPSPWGVGTLGKAAREFADFLALSGQTCWQILPAGPTGFGDSPYQPFSSFAGNPYFIDLDDLAAEGLLRPEEYRHLNWGADPGRVDYGLLYNNRYPVLRKACSRLEGNAEFAAFREEQKSWLEDYALFMALKGKHGGAAWSQWPECYRLRDPEALRQAGEELRDEVAFWSGIQFLFFRQWAAFRTYVKQKGISILGDLPIYVSGDSADVWSHPEQFQLDSKGQPVEVAGCPPDAFSDDGQLWGNPLFDWEKMKQDGYSWWISRIAAQFRLFDILRIDHFRGFESYYAIPYGDTTARNGRWRPGPGLDFFRAVEAALGKREIIAEDLGVITPPVRELLKATGYPGMKVLEFAFGNREDPSDYLPRQHTANCVVYAGTHDNDTILGWMQNGAAWETEYAREYLRLTPQEGYNWGMMRTAWASAADLAIMQMQDVLGLGSEARMNTPSTSGSNWQWRCRPGMCTEELARQLLREARLYHRIPKAEP